jgi:hypothetical protein
MAASRPSHRVPAALACACACACGGSSGGPATTITVDATSPGAAVPDDFLGVSVEWNSVRAYLGDGTGHARAPSVALLAAFAAEGHHAQVRIGGNSEDQSWWNPNGLPRPAGVLYDLDAVDLGTLADVQGQLGDPLVLGLNLVLGDADNAAALVTAAQAAIPPAAVRAFELGNEPDVFESDGNRPAGYDWTAYQTDVHTFRDAISAHFTAAPPFQWPAVARRDWLADLAAQIPVERDHVAIVSTHTYPYTVCSQVLPPPPDALLDPIATVQIAAAYRSVAQAAHGAGVPYRMGELNSVSCGGAAGVSDVYASALWGADICMQLAEVGTDGVNFHGGAPPGVPSYYAPFEIDTTGAPRVRPLYYGLRLVSLATASHGRLVPVTLAAPAGATDRIDAFATLGDDGAIRVLAIRLNDTGSGSLPVTITGATAGAATLVRLRGPSLDASAGLTLGGATWDGSVDGAPLGTVQPEPLTADGAGWSFELAPYDAVVITLAP